MGVVLRSTDEAHCLAVAARLAEDGGPVYGNALAPCGPAVYWLAGGVFRVAGTYNIPVFRFTVVLWWAGTALAVAWAARGLMGPWPSVAAAGAFLLSAMQPGFQDLRPEVIVGLPVALAVGVCARGVARGSAWLLVVAGACAAGAFLTRQQSGPLVGAVALLPLLAWRRGERVRALCGAALVVAGFVAAVAAVWGLFTLQGAAHEFVFCMWGFGVSYMRHAMPSGGFLSSPAFLVGRLSRLAWQEPFVPVALVGMVAGLARRGGDGAALSVRRRAGWLAALFGSMWLAASPGGVEWPSPTSYISYAAFLHVPACLLVGLCVELLDRRDGRRTLAAALAGITIAYVALPIVAAPGAAELLMASYVKIWGVGSLLLATGGLAVTTALLGGRHAVWLTPLVWVAAYLGGSGALGADPAHGAAAAGLVAVAVLWHAVRRRSLALGAVACVVHLGACTLDWAPQFGAALGAAVWAFLPSGEDKTRGRAPAVLFLATASLMAAALFTFGLAPRHEGSTCWGRAIFWSTQLAEWLRDWRLLGSLALAALALVPRRMRGSHPAGLLLLAGAAALLCGVEDRLGTGGLAMAGAASVVAAALGLEALCARKGMAVGDRARVLLACACVVPGVWGLANGLRAPHEEPPHAARGAVAEAVEPGATLYVWGGPHVSTVYVRARAVPGVPQVFSWMLEGVGPPPAGNGLLGRPARATRVGLDTSLCAGLPQYVAISGDLPDGPDSLPRFGEVLRERYRLETTIASFRIYRRNSPSAPPRALTAGREGD